MPELVELFAAVVVFIARAEYAGVRPEIYYTEVFAPYTFV